jgi:hypothetical protein
MPDRLGLVTSRYIADRAGEAPWVRRRRIPDASTLTTTSYFDSQRTGHDVTSPTNRSAGW